MTAKYFNLNFIRKEKISKDVYCFYFSRRVKRGSDDRQLDFLAGQYLHMYLPVVNENGRGDSRMFTIASSPMEADFIFFAIKKGKSIFKKSLFKLIPKTSVKFYGPSGGLIIDEIKKTSYVFLGLGIGITPFRSIIKYVSQKNIKIFITLIVSFSKKEDFVFAPELLKISKSNPNIKIVYSLNRISNKLIKKYIKNINKHLYYIVGASSAISNIEKIVSRMGVPDEKIFLEDFEGY